MMKQPRALSSALWIYWLAAGATGNAPALGQPPTVRQVEDVREHLETYSTPLRTYDGEAIITAVEKVPRSEGYKVFFRFNTQAKLDASAKEFFKLRPIHRFQLLSQRTPNPGAAFLKKYGIEEGKTFKASMWVGGNGTPFGIRLLDVDDRDLFSAYPMPDLVVPYARLQELAPEALRLHIDAVSSKSVGNWTEWSALGTVLAVTRSRTGLKKGEVIEIYESTCSNLGNERTSIAGLARDSIVASWLGERIGKMGEPTGNKIFAPGAHEFSFKTASQGDVLVIPSFISPPHDVPDDR